MHMYMYINNCFIFTALVRKLSMRRPRTKEVGVARSHDVAANVERSLDEVAVDKEKKR